jgi:serine/threonine-protein kinase
VKYCDTCHAAYPSDFVSCPKDQGTLRSVTELLPGLVLRGKYEILQKLGAGGMGAVYKARHTAFGELRALKVIGTHLVGDEDYLARFRSEAVLARKLQHPNVVRVDDFDQTDDGRPFIVMEYVEGRSLRHVIHAEGALGATRAAQIARQACEGLAAAHALGILHRDIKPDNILLVKTADGGEQVKLLDFGLAKVAEGYEGAGGQVATRTGMLIGTPQYLAPEQATGARGAPLDGRLDLYALGVVMYEMLVGRVPFDSDTPMGIVMHHLQTQPVPPHVANPAAGIPGPISAVVLQALEKAPNRRYASAREMADAIHAVTSASATLVPLSPYPVSTATPAPVLSAAPTVPPVSTAAPTAPRQKAPRFSRPLAAPPQPSPAPAVWPWLLAAVVLGAGALWWTRPRAAAPDSPPSVAVPAAVPAAAAPAGPGGAAPSRPGDDALRNEVERLLFLSPALRDVRFGVAVANGIVTLTGEAPDATTRGLALSLAGSVPGVVRVFDATQFVSAPAASPVVEATPAPVAAAPGPAPSAPPAPAPPAGESEEVRSLLARARDEIQAGRHEEAARIFEEVLKRDPGNPMAREALERFRNRRPPPH